MPVTLHRLLTPSQEGDVLLQQDKAHPHTTVVIRALCGIQQTAQAARAADLSQI